MPKDAVADMSIGPAGGQSPTQQTSPLASAAPRLLGLTLAIVALETVLTNVIWQVFGRGKSLISFAASVGQNVVACDMKLRENMPRITRIAIRAGIYTGFTGLITILIYFRFLFDALSIDAQLMHIDKTLLGSHWAPITTALAAYPAFGETIGWSHSALVIWPLAPLNLEVMQSALPLGGYHFIGMTGGILVFGLAYIISVVVVPRTTDQVFSRS